MFDGKANVLFIFSFDSNYLPEENRFRSVSNDPNARSSLTSVFESKFYENVRIILCVAIK